MACQVSGRVSVVVSSNTWSIVGLCLREVWPPGPRWPYRRGPGAGGAGGSAAFRRLAINPQIVAENVETFKTLNDENVNYDLDDEKLLRGAAPQSGARGPGRWLYPPEGVTKAIWKIILPVARPGIVATGIFCFLVSWNEFIFALILTGSPKAQTIPVIIAGFLVQLRFYDYGPMFAAAVLAVVPPVVVAFAFQGYLVRGMLSGSLKG